MMLFSGCQYFNPIGPIISIGVYWVQGEAHKYYNTDYATTEKALINALAELKIPIRKQNPGSSKTVITAGDGDRFSIKIIQVKPEITKISIRVNIFGDHPFAELIYRHVDSQPGIKQFANLETLNRKMNWDRV